MILVNKVNTMMFKNLNYILISKNKILFFVYVYSAILYACNFNDSYVNHLSQHVFMYAVFFAIRLSSILVQTRIYDHHYFDSNDYHKSVNFRNRIKFCNMIVSLISSGIFLHQFMDFFSVILH